MTAPFLNIATYRFVPLADLPALRQRLFDTAQAHGVRGTVLLAEEGINLCLAGPADGIGAWLAVARAQPGLDGLPTKDSWSTTQPFGRLKVKIKPEIIRMNMPGVVHDVRPAAGRAPAVSAATLARWITQGHCDAGRPLALLDTRNGFEVDAGAFDGAIDWRLQKFSDFPAAVAVHRDALAGHTVVSYCTGGIRCEKAALVLQDLGVPHALQLEGGILKYFEDTGGAAPGWRGSCFVFDDRVALAPSLTPSPAPAPIPADQPA
ncbi:MAG: sulfurtransferase [Burkholderiaceae bacterium]|nr:sulfurtransferase [Burkholderiaceae bacterium]